MTRGGERGERGRRTMTPSAVCFPVFSLSSTFFSRPMPSTIMIEDCLIDTLVGDIHVGTCSNSSTENLFNSDSVQKQVKSN